MDIKKYLCFPETYAEGRDWFLATAEKAGAAITSAVNPHAKDPDGKILATDTAWFGPKTAAKVFVSISGTHGQEYFFGVAGQLNWMLSEAPKALPEDVAVLLIHANNPYGAAYGSRGNENFVDVNRNYFDPGTEIRPTRLYGDIFDIIAVKEMSEHVMDDIMADLYAFIENNDTQEAMTALGGGQNTHPSGILYCGTGDEWSTINMRNIVKTQLAQAKVVAIIDWHTGIGPYAELTVLNELDPKTEGYRWACAWWSGPEDSHKLLAEEHQPDYIGNVNWGMAEDLKARDVKVANTVIEMGTMDNPSVLAALMVDRWLRFECNDRNSPHAVALHTKMMERLNPSLHSWREASIDKSYDIYARTIKGLSSWD